MCILSQRKTPDISCSSSLLGPIRCLQSGLPKKPREPSQLAKPAKAAKAVETQSDSTFIIFICSRKSTDLSLAATATLLSPMLIFPQREAHSAWEKGAPVSGRPARALHSMGTP